MEKLKAVDLFSGAGGLSQGFREAGFDIVFANDFDKNSAKTYKANHPGADFIRRDIHELSSEEILNTASLKEGDLDILVGGPPCQGFSIAGERNEDDSRNELFKEFVRVVGDLSPKFFLMENVPGILSMETPSGRPVKAVILEKFSDIGYQTKYKLLKSTDYGVPQERERVFFIGTRLNERITFPAPCFSPRKGQQKLTHQRVLPSYLTVGEALSDLPGLEAGEKGEKYGGEPENWYQRLMRRKINDSRFKNHHAVSHRQNIVERFKHIPQGGDMSDAPEELQPEKHYSSRNRRLKEDAPAYTVTSHVLDELIHPWDDRSITVREAARLQSFPDHYIFKGERNLFHSSPKTSQYEQVGNAVPALLARGIATHIRVNYFGGYEEKKDFQEETLEMVRKKR